MHGEYFSFILELKFYLLTSTHEISDISRLTLLVNKTNVCIYVYINIIYNYSTLYCSSYTPSTLIIIVFVILLLKVARYI